MLNELGSNRALIEPTVKRTYAFFDGQNLFHSAKKSYGSKYPDYDPLALAQNVCASQGWRLDVVYFYTGMPDHAKDPVWHKFWAGKTTDLGKRGVVCYTRPLAYRMQTFICPNCGPMRFPVKTEKGIDTRLAIDVVRFGRQGLYDVALVFSQDQDISEATEEVKRQARGVDRWVKVACAFPDPNGVQTTDPCVCGSGKEYRRCCGRFYRGINGTDWIRIERATYTACLDPLNYR